MGLFKNSWFFQWEWGNFRNIVCKFTFTIMGQNHNLPICNTSWSFNTVIWYCVIQFISWWLFWILQKALCLISLNIKLKNLLIWVNKRESFKLYCIMYIPDLPICHINSDDTVTGKIYCTQWGILRKCCIWGLYLKGGLTHMYKIEPEWGFLKIISMGQGLCFIFQKCFEGSSLHVLVI